MHELVILVAKYFVIVPLIIVAFVWLQLEQKDKLRFVLLAVASGIVALVLAKIGSKLYYDPRPFITGHFTPYFPHANDNGFPSDHTLLSAWLGFLALTRQRRLGALALLFAVLVGGARMIAGVHHLLDIVGSFVCAAVAVGICCAVLASTQQATAAGPDAPNHTPNP